MQFLNVSVSSVNLVREEETNVKLNPVLSFLIVLFLGVNVGHFGDAVFPTGIVLLGINFYWGVLFLLIPILAVITVYGISQVSRYNAYRRNKLKDELKAEILKEIKGY